MSPNRTYPAQLPIGVTDEISVIIEICEIGDTGESGEIGEFGDTGESGEINVTGDTDVNWRKSVSATVHWIGLPFCSLWNKVHLTFHSSAVDFSFPVSRA